MKPLTTLTKLGCSIVSAALVCMLFAGCNPSEKPVAKTDTESGGSSNSHDHGDHAVGPHGGHLLHLDPAGTHAEWTHDDDNNVTVHLDDFAEVSAAKFVVKVGDQTEEFALESGDDGWSLTSEPLMNHINMGEAAEVQLVVSTGGVDHTTKIEGDHEGHHHH